MPPQFYDLFHNCITLINRLIDVHEVNPELREQAEIERFISGLAVDFPTSEIMSAAAREIQNTVYNHAEFIVSNPDRRLIEWTDVEYRLFRALEYARYGAMITGGFATVEDYKVSSTFVQKILYKNVQLF